MDIGDVFVEEGEVFTGKDGTRKKEETEGVGRVLIHEFVGVGEVAKGFAHFATVVASERAGSDDILVGILVTLLGFIAESTNLGESSIDGMNIVEPSTNLADIFNNEVGGVVMFEFLFVFERVVELGKRHRAGFKPTIKNLVDTNEMV